MTPTTVTTCSPITRVNLDPPLVGVPSLGPASAKVVVQEFVRLPCSSCRADREGFERGLAPYRGRIRVLVRPYSTATSPDQDGPAAEAALEVYAQRGIAAFWKFVDLSGVEIHVSRAQLEQAARSIGVDMKRFTAALDTHVHDATVAKTGEDVRKVVELLRRASTSDDALLDDLHSYVIGDYPIGFRQRSRRYRTLIERALKRSALHGADDKVAE